MVSVLRHCALLLVSGIVLSGNAHAAGVLYNDPGWLHAYEGVGDYYHNPDGYNPNYLADPDPTNNQPGGQHDDPALIDPGPCGGTGQPSCQDAAIWQMDRPKWDGTAPGDPLIDTAEFAKTTPPNRPPAPGGAAAYVQGGTTYLRIQDAGVPNSWGWAEKNARATLTAAKQEGSNDHIAFKHYMNRDVGYSGRADIIDFGVTVSFRARIATTAGGPLDMVYPGQPGSPTPWPADGIGYHVGNEGRSIFQIGQDGAAGPSEISFGLINSNHQAVFLPNLPGLTRTGLVMNNRFGVGSADTHDATPAVLNIYDIPHAQLNDWNEFWITINKLPAPVAGNTHEVKVWANGFNSSQ